MLVGEVISGLVDKDANMKMSFGTDDMDTAEALWWKSIPQVEDKIGSLDALTLTAVTKIAKKAPKKNPQAPSKAIQHIETSDSEDSEFTPYALPDSDPEDSPDEDATTIDRNAPKAPV